MFQLKTLIFILIVMFSIQFSYAQFGSIIGKVNDAETGKGIPFVKVLIVKNGFETTFLADKNGFYEIKGIPVGELSMYFLSADADYIPSGITNILLHEQETIKINQILEICFGLCNPSKVRYRMPLINHCSFPSGRDFTRQEVNRFPK